MDYDIYLESIILFILLQIYLIVFGLMYVNLMMNIYLSGIINLWSQGAMWNLMNKCKFLVVIILF